MADVRRYCAGCGTHVEPSARFCSGCETPVRAARDATVASTRAVGGALCAKSEGFTTFQDIVLAKQLVFQRLDSDEEMVDFRYRLRAIGDVELNAPFSIRSAIITRHFEMPSSYGLVEGYLFDQPLRPDRTWPADPHSSHAFVFWKDLRTKAWSGKPRDPNTYGRWLLVSSKEFDELKKKLKP